MIKSKISISYYYYYYYTTSTIKLRNSWSCHLIAIWFFCFLRRFAKMSRDGHVDHGAIVGVRVSTKRWCHVIVFGVIFESNESLLSSWEMWTFWDSENDEKMRCSWRIGEISPEKNDRRWLDERRGVWLAGWLAGWLAHRTTLIFMRSSVGSPHGGSHND